MFADTTTIIHHCKHFLLTNGESGKHAAFSVLRRNLLPARYSGRGSTRFDAKDQSIGAPSVRKKRGLKPHFFACSVALSLTIHLYKPQSIAVFAPPVTFFAKCTFLCISPRRAWLNAIAWSFAVLILFSSAFLPSPHSLFEWNRLRAACAIDVIRAFPAAAGMSCVI